MHTEKKRSAALADVKSNPGDTLTRIAKRHYVARTSLVSWLAIDGYRRPRGGSNEYHPAIIQARRSEKEITLFSRAHSTWTEDRIANKFGVCENTVSNILRRMGEGRKPGFGSPAHPLNKKVR